MSRTTKITCFPGTSALDNKSVFLDVYAGQRCPNVMFSKTDVAQDGCTVICRNTNCYNIGTHRCAACERESYCSEDCRRQDRPRHVEDCLRHAIAGRLKLVKHFDRMSSCQGLATRHGNKACPNKVVSFCRHCEATVCHRWECSKFHLEQCSAYVEAMLEREWVLITMIGKGQVEGMKDGGPGEEEQWVVVEKNQRGLSE
jgi:hypothetical protein